MGALAWEEPQKSSNDTARQAVQAAREDLRSNRKRGLTALELLFRTGEAPASPLEGSYHGELFGFSLPLGLGPGADALLAVWKPWKGKCFDPATQRGDNVLGRSGHLVTRLVWPLYGRYIKESARTFRGFAFRTYRGAGIFNPDRMVLKLDYNLPGNPRLNVRRVVDEVVKLADGLYLGKWHIRPWWGNWQTIAYFTLESV